MIYEITMHIYQLALYLTFICIDCGLKALNMLTEIVTGIKTQLIHIDTNKAHKLKY